MSRELEAKVKELSTKGSESHANHEQAENKGSELKELEGPMQEASNLTRANFKLQEVSASRSSVNQPLYS